MIEKEIRKQVLEQASFDVLIKRPGKVYADIKNISYTTAQSLCKDIIEKCNDQKLADQLAMCMESFGFRGYAGDGYDITISAYNHQNILPEKHCCKSRVQQPTEKDNEDVWIKRGNDIVCGYCGSASWDTFKQAIEDVLNEKEDCGIERSDKKHKYYIQNPTVPNAGFGAIKFYTWHVPALELEVLDEWNQKLQRACDMTHKKLLEKFNIPSS